MKSVTTAAFRKAFDQLAGDAQDQARDAYRKFQQDPFHQSLRFRQVHPSQPIYSVRVNLNCRALGIRDGDTMVWFWIGTHGDYEHLLARS